MPPMAHGETPPPTSPAALVSGRLPGMKRELALLLSTLSPAAPELGRTRTRTRSRSAKKTKISGAELAGEAAEEVTNALLPYDPDGPSMTKLKKSKSKPKPRTKKSKTDHPQPSQPHQDENSGDLHLDIMVQILSHLPGSILSRFRFISKQWLSIVTTNSRLPAFHIDNGFYPGTATILIHSYLPRVSSKLTLIDPKGRRERVFDINKKHNIISPSCNGLVCTYNSVSVSIFNPTTKQYLPLPKPTKSDSGWHRCLLGYLRRGRKYKVIRFFCEPFDKRPMCEVLTVGESSWRQIDTGFALSRHRHSGGVVMGGAVYSILESVKTKKSEVVSFNLADESFQIIDGPDLSKAQRCWIFEWKGRISVMQRFPSRKIQIWTLEDITTRTWTSTDRVKVECGLLDITPIVIENNILVMSGWHLRFCELEKGKAVAEICRHDPILQGAQLHIESVVNLDAF